MTNSRHRTATSEFIDLNNLESSISSTSSQRLISRIGTGVDILLDWFIPSDLIEYNRVIMFLKKDDVIIGTFGKNSKNNQTFKVIRPYNTVDKTIRVVSLSTSKSYRISDNKGFGYDGSIYLEAVNTGEPSIKLFDFKGIYRHVQDLALFNQDNANSKSSHTDSPIFSGINTDGMSGNTRQTIKIDTKE